MAQPNEILARLEEESVLEVTLEEWEGFLAEAEKIREEKPILSEAIRVLRIGGRIVVQETSNRKEILLRRFAGVEEADAFVRDRMDTYDRMWDGCGCRVDYYE
ncbi:MAG: hypothetical protein JW958_01035 [Candidatus Eisenbacteria bacterium]|nr:hypothetical protein [Candidatus Eisenbacteria bacterium]